MRNNCFAFICDKNYVIPTAVTMYSIIDSCGVDEKLYFYIVTSDPEEEIDSFFRLFENDNVIVRVITRELGDLSSLHDYRNSGMCAATPSALLKFQLPNILEDIDKVLYLDGDLIVKDDIRGLFDINIEDNYLAAVVDSGVIYSGRNKVKNNPNYFNSGVMLLNLSKMREDNISEKLVENKRQSIDFALMDQDVFNDVCGLKLCKLGVEYNFLYVNLERAKDKYDILEFNRLYDRSYFNIQDCFKNAKVIHFASKDKPWKVKYVVMARVWYKVLLRMDEKVITPLDLIDNKYVSQTKELINGYLKNIPDLIVSLTSFPERINAVGNVIEDILNQIEIPDRIILWLAESQFSGLNSLPWKLRDLCRYGLEIRFCDNLYSHKKYYYVMQENPDDIVVTVDDDLEYDGELLFDLWNSHVKYPECVVASRVHSVDFNNEKEICPYVEWKQELSSVFQIPSFNLFSTSGAGTLYPCHSMHKDLFDKDKIMHLCPTADDVWLKVMQILKGTKTVLARPSKGLKTIDGTQVEQSLYKINRRLGGNDACIKKIITEYRNNNIVETLNSDYERIVEVASEPTVSVFIPVFDAGMDLRRSLDSLLNQNLYDIEIFVIDNGSKKKLLDEFQRLDSRINLIYTNNSDITRYISLAKGQFIMILDGNNFYNEDYLFTTYKNAKLFDVDTVLVRGNYEFGNNRARHYFNTNYSGLRGYIVEKPSIEKTDIFGMITEYWFDKLFERKSFQNKIESGIKVDFNNAFCAFQFVDCSELLFLSNSYLHICEKSLMTANEEMFKVTYSACKKLINDTKDIKTKENIKKFSIRIILRLLYFSKSVDYSDIYIFLKDNFKLDFDISYSDICDTVLQRDFQKIENGYVMDVSNVALNIDMENLRTELQQLRNENEKLKFLAYCLDETRKSFSYRLGLAMTALPRKIRKKRTN